MNMISTAVNRRNAHRSLRVMVRMLPKRNELSSGTYPGVRNMNRVPTAIPIAHITAMAESSRTLWRAAIHWTPRDEPMANTAAIATGLIPKK